MLADNRYLLTQSNRNEHGHFVCSRTDYGLATAVIALRNDDDITGKGERRFRGGARSGSTADHLGSARRILEKRAEDAMVRNVGTAMLSSFLSKNILQICHNKYNPKNNCAHFVGHVLGIEVGVNCFNVAPALGSKPGFTIRVDDLFNLWCPDKGLWSNKPAAVQDCLFFIRSRAMYPGLRFGWDRMNEACWNLCRWGGLALLKHDAESGHDDRFTDA
jgi:hypothetical protein